jgi:hypothetical protein
MDNIPRQKLREIILQYGRSLCDDPKRCEAFLQDFCGRYRKEVSVLIIALKERVPADLLASPNSIPPVVLLARLTKRLQENVSLTEDAARWAVESWGLALGVISEADIASIPSSSPPPQVPPQYRQENVNQTPVPSKRSSFPSSQAPQENVNSVSKTDPSFQQSKLTVIEEDSSIIAKANKQIKNAWIAGTISGIVTLIVTFILQIRGMLIDVLLIFGLTWGIYKKSRICAVIMFIYFILSKILLWQTLNPLNLLIALLFIYLFIYLLFLARNSRNFCLSQNQENLTNG